MVPINSTTWRRSRARAVLGAVMVVVTLLAGTGPASADAATLTVTASADTFVSSSAPNKSYGTIKQTFADASPVKQALLRFNLTGIGERLVVRATLRLTLANGSDDGGSVATVSGPWDETTTWSTRPVVDGAVLATIGAVGDSGVVDVDVTAAVLGDGPVSLAITSSSSDGVAYATRETLTPPQLVVEVDDGPPPPPPPPVEGPDLSVIAGSLEGSSAPSAYANNHHVAVTSLGRELVVYGRHQLGVQLAWRDASAAWSNVTRGAALDGMLLTGTGTGDWPASVVVGTDSAGVEHAWVAFGGDAATSSKPVLLRRISGLNDPAGPVIGPLVTVAPAGDGAGLVDLALVPGADGGAITWSARAGSAYEQRVAFFDDLDVDEPAIGAPSTRSTGSSGYLSGTLIPTSTGIALAYRNGANRLQVDQYQVIDGVGTWTAGAAGVTVPSKSHVGAVALDSGEVLATTITDRTNGIITVQRFSATGQPVGIEAIFSGYREPSLASDGADAWLVAIRIADGYVISRHRATGAWSSADVLEVGAEGGGGYAWPNLMRRPDGRLRFIVQGPAGSDRQRAVLGFQRPL
jgi:hypothetical protein